MNIFEFIALAFLLAHAVFAMRDISRLTKERDEAIAIAKEFVEKTSAARKALEGVSSCSSCGVCRNVSLTAIDELDA